MMGKWEMKLIFEGSSLIKPNPNSEIGFTTTNLVQAKDILVNLAIIMAIDPITIVDADETVMSVTTVTSTSIYRPHAQLSDKVCFPSEEKVKLSVDSRSLNNVFILPNSD